jgi:formylglycine-generating enzyme required for sulfatase activity
VRTKVPSTVERLYGKDGGEQSPNAIGNLRGAPAALARIGPGGFNRPLPQGAQPAPLNAPFNRQKALDARKAWAEYAELAEERKNSLGMALVLIPPGEFRMGSEETFEELVQRFPHAKASVDRHSIVGALLSSASPQHPVRITTPYYLGAFEVTVGQFRKFVNATHYKTDAEQHGKGGSGYVAERGNEAKITQSAEFTWRDWGVDQSDESPVVNVSWNDAAAFCKWLSQKEGATYRLPTEAEWEYACRAGTITRYYNGNDPENVTQIGNVSDATTKAQLPTQTNNVTSSDGWAFTSPVGRFQANNFGLYDMIGNAREWCQDWWSESYYRQSPKLNPTGPPKGSLRVIRGGGWNNGDFSCRSANRFASVPTHRDCIQGFRVVCER